jgi:hypothetical protein
MKKARLFGGVAALCAFVLAALLFAHVPARGVDLQDSPVTVSRPSADITDTYLFPSPTNPGNVVVVMDVHPLIPASANATSALNTFFDNGVLYTMKFDTNYSNEAANGGRPVEQLVMQFAFSAPTGPTGNQTQQISVYGPLGPVQTGTATKLVNGGAASGAGFINRPFSFDSGQIQVFAGARRDPTFFDYSLFKSIFPASTTGSGASCYPSTCPAGFGTGPNSDTFGSTDVLSIVVEMPRSLVANGGNGVIAYWATTSTSSGQ